MKLLGASNSLRTTISLFTACQIILETGVNDNEFEAVRKALTPVNAKIVVTDEHKGNVERLVHTVKKDTRCDFQNNFPKLMGVSSLEANTTWLNSPLNKNVISKTLSSSAIVLDALKIDSTHDILQTVSYAHFKVKSRRTNGMKTMSMEESKARR